MTNDDMREIIAKNLNILVRRPNSKTITQIANEAGLTQPSLSQMLAGQIMPTTFTVIRLCKVLDCNYEDILGRL